MPEASSVTSPRRRSRKDVYRKKLRKRRLRRAVAFAFLLLVSVVTCLFWQMQYPDLSYVQAMQQAWMYTNDMLSEGSEWIVHKYEYTFTDREAREKEQFQRDEEARLQRIAAERKAKAEARAREAEAKRIELEKKAMEAKLREQKAEEARLREIEQQNLERQRELARPWACNLPLSYVVHPRCRKLAKVSPIYDEDAVIASFLQ